MTMSKASSEINRRKFLTAASAGIVSAGIAGLVPSAVLGQVTEKKETAAKKEVIQRTLGRTGLKMPIISMGMMNANNPEVVQASYEMGVRHFDTAAYYQYGSNEQMVGNVISKLKVRDKVIIGTKIHTPGQRNGLDPEESKKKLIANCEASLQRLKMDYVDILYLHDVSDTADVSNPGIVEGMKLLKDQGKVRFVGVSTHSNMTGIINEVTRQGSWDVVLTAVNFTMADDVDLLMAIKNGADKGVGIVAMKALAGGGRWPNPESRRNYSSSTIARAALKWVLRNESITTSIPGYTNFEHMNEDFSVAFDLDYAPEEKKFLEDNQIKLGFGFCRQCRGCLASCPNGADVPNLMRTHMYAAQYGNFHQARITLDDIPRRSGLDACRNCDTCMAGCVNTVDIGRRIEELKLIYS
ncbi:MAG: oxidoreductase [candidate division Zixibacteria bacterium HGW-Zixibacteria-1]|nr:MAG: oxidoreductase [candidate division Zixibacteria bacterium HGW-Zixibacteria-1]